MKKIAFALAAVASTVTLTSCDELELDTMFSYTVPTGSTATYNGMDYAAGTTFDVTLSSILQNIFESFITLA